MDYSGKTCAELIALCKERGIKGYSGKRKSEIVDLLRHRAPCGSKTQRKTTGLGFNTAGTQDNSYTEIEAKFGPTARCSDGQHVGERVIPIRMFYLNKGGMRLQGACIACQKRRRADRIGRSRNKFAGKTEREICDMYVRDYGPTKTCSKCGVAKPPLEFPLSISMETGLHNRCAACVSTASQGSTGLRDFIFMPDKDGLRYRKKSACEKCGGTSKLAVDHIIPISKGGSDCIENKQTLCVHCNSRKSDTVECAVIDPNLLCERYREMAKRYSADNAELTRALTMSVYEFRRTHIIDASDEEIRSSVKEYARKNNLGNNLDRITRKIIAIRSE